MSRVWGREETYRWPSDKPVWTITVLVVAVVTVPAAAVHEYAKWPYFQQAYLGMYIGSEVRLWSKTAPALVAYRIEGKQKRLAVDRDLSDPAVGVGKTAQAKAKLEWERGTYTNAELRQWLERAIYGGQSPWLLLWAATWKVGAGVLVVGLGFALPRDRQRRRVLKYGRRTKGPVLATAAQFNGNQQSNGIGFITKERRTYAEFLLQREGKMVRVPRERESSHFMMIGDTGAGKSSLIRQILMQVEERGETAIVYDPALEYAPQFYEPGRGDVILNPVDARMPYWSPCDEVRHEAEAEGLAAALFKDDPRTNPFFVMVPRQIFAHLLIEQPKRTPQELLAILRDEGELTKRLKDTEHAAKDDDRYSSASILSTVESLTLQSAEKDSQLQVRSQLSVDNLATRGYIFRRIPNTATEVTSIAALFPSSATVRTGVDARKLELLQTDLGRFKFVHFATHGFFPVEPGIREPALILSYDGEDEGRMMLTLSEVLQLKLHAEMVALSACNTGSGRVTRAEGVASLGTAFLAAGASSVTVSLWKVEDQSTSVLMQEFYRNLLKGMSKDAALAGARSTLFSQGHTNPFFWAPFVLTGE